METTREKVLSALEEIRPYLLSDGGDVELVEIKDNVVRVKFLGNCHSCDINKTTLKLGIESTIKKHAPEIEEIINV